MHIESFNPWKHTLSCLYHKRMLKLQCLLAEGTMTVNNQLHLLFALNLSSISGQTINLNPIFTLPLALFWSPPKPEGNICYAPQCSPSSC